MFTRKWLKTILILCLSISTLAVSEFASCAATVLTPAASGIRTYGTKTVQIDASNTKDGYIMVKYTGKAPRIKVRIRKTTEYTYDLNTSGRYETFPLTEGNGDYMVIVYENVKDNLYCTTFSKQISVSMPDENRPFLFPNQFCNYNASTKAVSVGDELVEGLTDTLDKVNAIYHYVVTNTTYDHYKARTVKSGYLPVIDSTLSTKRGICFDYSALMTAMLRTQDIPTKLVIGYVGSTYHAWISVYTEERGWIEDLIFFDGTDWKYMDPTFASGALKNPNSGKDLNDTSDYIARFSY